MSIVGILGSSLFSTAAAQHVQNSQNTPSVFQQIKTEFQQLGQDLQSGNLQAAQQDFTNLQQDVQQASNQQVQGHHGRHHHRAEGLQDSSSSQQSSPIAQALSALAQDLQAGNLSGAQSAFSALANDLQQIGGFLTAGSVGASGPAGTPTSSNLNVTA